MKIKKIELINFRNYKQHTFYPNDGVNIITGSNGIGKTNLVESIYYLNLARGFKNKNQRIQRARLHTLSIRRHNRVRK